MIAPERTRSPRTQRTQAILLAGAILLLAANLRPAVVGVAPLVDQIRADLGVGSATAGLLTSLPVLCFGLLAPLAPRLSRRFGLEVVLLGALVVLAAGIALRLVPVTGVLLVASVVVGTAIAIGNVSLPPLVKRDFPQHTGVMTGLYSMVLTAGGAVAAAVTVPFQRLTGLDWRFTLGAWGVLTVVTVVIWAPRALRAAPTRVGGVPTPSVARALLRDPLAWCVTLFMGIQSLHFYALSAWVPAIFTEAGWSRAQAGLLLALAGFVGLFFSALAPVLASRLRNQGPLIAAVSVAYLGGYGGLLLAPGTASALWMVLLGVAQGSNIALALLLITLRSPDPAVTGDLSAMAQGIGYVLAAAGPSGLGALHDLTGSWTVPLVTMLVLVVPLVATGLVAGRDRHVLAGGGAVTRPASASAAP